MGRKGSSTWPKGILWREEGSAGLKGARRSEIQVGLKGRAPQQRSRGYEEWRRSARTDPEDDPPEMYLESKLMGDRMLVLQQS